MISPMRRRSAMRTVYPDRNRLGTDLAKTQRRAHLEEPLMPTTSDAQRAMAVERDVQRSSLLPN